MVEEMLEEAWGCWGCRGEKKRCYCARLLCVHGIQKGLLLLGFLPPCLPEWIRRDGDWFCWNKAKKGMQGVCCVEKLGREEGL